MSETLYGLSWLEAVAPSEKNYGATQQRRRVTFKTENERKFAMLKLEAQPEFLYHLSTWEEKNV